MQKKPRLNPRVRPKKVSPHAGAALHDAAERGDVESVKRLLQVWSVDVAGPNRETALHLASRGGHAEVVECLLGAGADVNARSGDFGTPLHAAAEGGSREVLLLLIDSGAVHESFYRKYDKYRTRITPLSIAASSGHQEAVELLMDSYGEKSPVCSAAAGGHFDLCRKLVRDGGSTEELLVFAIQTGAMHLVRLVLEVDPLAKMPRCYGEGGAALHLASLRGYIEVMQFLLREKHFDVTYTDGFGFSPMSIAATRKYDSVAALNLLLDNGADINERNSLKSPLEVAASHGDEEAVALLVSRGAEVDLTVVAQLERPGILGMLLSTGAGNPNVTGAEGRTPLHAAARAGCLPSVKLLLRHGGVPACDDQGRTPLHLAVQACHPKLVHHLCDKRTCDGVPLCKVATNTGWTPLHTAVHQRFATHTSRDSEVSKVVRVLLASAAPIAAKTYDGATPLRMALEGCLDKSVQVLLQDGRGRALVEERDLKGMTPLLIAVWKRYSRGVEILLASGADVNAKYADGRSAVHLAAKRGDVPTLTALLAAPAVRVDERDAQGCTPLHAACERGRSDVACMLLDAGASPSARSHAGFTPPELALEKGFASLAASF